jgi:branched-chain amino acid transport system ATP-binding protein
VLVAIRENEQRARFIGYPTNRYKLAGLRAVGGVTGLAGMLSLFKPHDLGRSDLGAFSGELLAMVVIGGMRSFLGPALGALFFILFREFLGIWTENWLFWFGLLFVGFIVFSPTGLVGVAERLLAPFRKRTIEDAAMAARTHRRRALPLPEFLRPKSHVDGPVLIARDIAKSFGGIRAVQGVDISCRPHAARADRAERRRQDHGVQPALRHVSARRGRGVAARASRSPGCARGDHARRRRPLVPDHQPVPGALGRGEHAPRRAGAASAPLRSLGANALAIDVNAETAERHALSRPRRHRAAEAGALSYGGQRLLDMGVALATAPRVLLLDEPLAGLAAAERERIGALIKRISADRAGAAGRARHRPGVPDRRRRSR